MPDGSIGQVASVVRAAADHADGVFVRTPASNDWRPLREHGALPAGAELRTDERTRASLSLADGTQLVLDHLTTISFDTAEPRHVRVGMGRLLADVAHVDNRPAEIDTPSGAIDVVGTRFVVTATDALTSVQVVRGQIVLRGGNAREDVRAGEEGTIEHEHVSVSPVPSLAHEVEWAELKTVKPDEITSGLGSLRAYKPGESRDRDWNLALAKHNVKVRIVGPIARTEITETFRNDSPTELEGVYQFPLPVDAQIDNLALDQKDGFIDGAFVDKERGQKIWKGVIDKATPHPQQLATNEIIWVDGSWRDPALLDWKRGGRFELRVFPIPPKGQRTIKLAYTQVVAPRGEWRQYVYPLPHSKDGSTVADQLDVDVEVRGGVPGAVRTLGYDLKPDAQRKDLDALTMHQAGFVPRGDLVIAYRAADGAAELRAWTYAGNAAVAPDEKLAEKKNVGIDPKVVAEQRAVAADTRPTAVIALRPKLPRWREAKPHDYTIVLDASQSMVGERFTRASELANALVGDLDRRDRFTIMTCDSECRSFGDLRAPTPDAARDAKDWLAKQTAAGATDLVASIRSAREAMRDSDRDRWVLYIGDGFSTTGFRRVADVEKALAGGEVHLTTIGIGSDADAPVLEAAARGGGGNYLAWLPGQRVGTEALAALESTNGSALRDATVELPQGLVDVAPTVLPTVRAGDEVLIAARVQGEAKGDVIVKGTVAGQPFEQRYPLDAHVSTSAGNGFVPRLWASLAIEQRERAGAGEDRAKVVALSQAYGVMSRETSLLVLESQAMFDAFGVDRHTPTAKWTGEEQLDEVATGGLLQVADNTKPADIAAGSAPAKEEERAKAKKRVALKDDDSAWAGDDEKPATKAKAPVMPKPVATTAQPAPAHHPIGGGGNVMQQNPMGELEAQRRANMVAMRRTWVRVPSVTAYDTASQSITKAIGEAERALQAKPDSREAHRALVQALAYAGEIDRAQQVAVKWLDRDKLDPQALGYQADLLGRSGQRELALRTLAGLVDLDADRVALHERMVQAYDQIGRAPQACSHRIALAAIQPKDAKAAGGALRCLRALHRDGDAELVARALPDDAARAAAEKSAMADPIAPKLAGDLVVSAHWDGGADLDLSLVTPDATRVSWMGGRNDAVVQDATREDREELAIKSLKRGNYLIEVARAAPSTDVIKGTLDITVLGTKKSLPFELRGDHATIGRIAISLEERLEQVDSQDFDAPQPRMSMGHVPDETLRRVMLARSTDVRQCYSRATLRDPSLGGRIVLTVSVGQYGQVQLRTQASNGGLAQIEQCMIGAFQSMHGNPNSGTFSVSFTFSPR
jgi:tetratricopeptide (TPR) repeat protein